MTTFWDLPWPDTQHYSIIAATLFSALFIKALVNAIQRSTRVHNDGTNALGSVAAGYLWATIAFWIAAIGFIAAYKG